MDAVLYQTIMRWFMLVRYQNKSLRYSLEDRLYTNQGVLDDTDVCELVSGTNYEIDFESYKWLSNIEYISMLNSMLSNFNSMFRIVEFTFNEITGGMWIFVKI